MPYRVQWAAAWIDRAERTRIQIDEMHEGMILKQILIPIDEAEALAAEILRLIMEPR